MSLLKIVQDLEQVKQCIKCGESKPLMCFYLYNLKHVKYNQKCTDCLSYEYKYLKYGTLCDSCGEPGHKNSNGYCKKCNLERGLYECRSCKNLLPLAYSFDGKHRQCKTCMQAKRKKRTKK